MNSGDSVPTARELRWARLARELEFEQLEKVRTQAEKWRSGLAAITAGVGVVMGVAAPFIGEETLTDDARCLLGCVALAALACLAVGTWCAMRASFGLPVTTSKTNVGLERWTRTETKKAADRLATARRLTAAGLVLLGVAAAVGYFGPRPDGQEGLVTLRDGSSYCGVLTNDEAGASLKIVAADGTVRVVEMIEVALLDLDRAC